MQVRSRRLFAGVACLVLLSMVAGVWLLPGMLDWNRYRDSIAALASQRLGRPVHIGGKVSLQLLPQPILTADDVAVESVPIDETSPATTDEGNGLHAKALRLRVALGPLLAGKVDARELILQGADLRLPWPPQPGALTQRLPSWLTGLQARIEDGRLQVGGLVVTGIQGTITTDPDTGTLGAAGMLQAGQRRWQFTARLARPGRDGIAGLDVSLDGQDGLRDTGGTFSGQIAGDGALSGRVAGRGPDLSLLMPAPALPWRGDGRLNAAAGLAIADELALEIDGAPARGAVALRVQPRLELDVSIAAGRLDLDAWLPALLASSSSTLRSGIPTGIAQSAEAATLAGGIVRRLRAGIDLATGVVHLRDVAALLPGDAQLALSGQVATDPQTRFDGDVRLQAPDLRGTLRWLQRVLPAGVASLPPGVLRTGRFGAKVTADAGQASVSELQGSLDGSQIAGSATLRLGTRSSLTAALTVNRLTLDPWLPQPNSLLTAASAQTAAAVLRSIDADLKLQIGTADWSGVPLGAVAVELQSEISRVMLRRLDAQPAGARLSLSGQVSDAGRLSDGRLDLSTPDLMPLRAALATFWTKTPILEPLLRGPGSLLVLAAGPAEAVTGRVQLELSDVRVEARPTVNIPARHWSGPITLHHPGAPRLLETLGLGGTAAWLGDGSLSLVGQVAITPKRLELEGATFAAGSMRVSGHLVADGTRVFGQVGFETLPLPLLYSRSPDPLPIAWLRGWQAALRVEAAEIQLGLEPVLHEASADVTLGDGVLRVLRGVAHAEGGVVNGGATLDAATDPPGIAVQAQAAGLPLPEPLFDTPLDLLGGRLDATGEVSAAGYSPAALLATLSGSAKIRIRDGTAAGFDLSAAAAALDQPDPRNATEAARTALLGGRTAFDTLDAPLTFERGVVSAQAKLATAAGEASLGGSLDLLGGSIDLRLALQPSAAGAPALTERLTGSPGAPVRTPELAGLARWLADRAQ